MNAIDPLEPTFTGIVQGVYDHLNFTQLIDLADKNDTARPIIRNEYMIAKYRVHERIFVITKIFRDVPHSNQYNMVEQFESAHKFLRHFGDLVSKLRFENNWSQLTDTEVTTLTSDIEKYLSDSLVDIELKRVGNYLLGKTKRVFSNVTYVKAVLDKYSDNYDLNRIYPKMETLYLQPSIFEEYPAKTVVRTYPNLKDLITIEHGSTNIFIDLLKVNPRIERLRLNELPSREFLMYIDNLPHLKELRIVGKQEFPINQITHFRHIEKFAVSISKWQSRAVPFTFDRLEEFSIDLARFVFLVQFIQQNPKLKVLSINSAYSRDYSEITSVVSRSNLQALRVGWSKRYISIEAIHRLMNANYTLKKITFFADTLPECEELLKNIPKPWTITNIEIYENAHDKCDITVERK